MSSDPSNLWSEAEDNALRQFYPRHGSGWDGWPEVLPNRTNRALCARANRLGLVAPVRPRKKPKRNPMPDGMHRKIDLTKEPDPHEGYVLACMEARMTPTEIDKRMHWWHGTTIRILTEMWERESDE